VKLKTGEWVHPGVADSLKSKSDKTENHTATIARNSAKSLSDNKDKKNIKNPNH